MNLKHISLVAIAVLGLAACQPENTTKETTTPEKPLISYVDPFIGTGGHGIGVLVTITLTA